MTDIPVLFTVETVAGKLGVGAETVRRAIRGGRLGCYRLGGCIRVSPEQLAAYLEASLCPPREQDATVVGEKGRELSSVVVDFRFKQRVRSALEPRPVKR